MDLAISQGRTILTFDRDYGELIFRLNYKPEKGVVYLRLDNYSPTDPGILIEKLLESGLDLFRALTVIDENGIRQRMY
jgi:predicted nuclease of predicted toxin-antitoxin system